MLVKFVFNNNYCLFIRKNIPKIRMQNEKIKKIKLKN